LSENAKNYETERTRRWRGTGLHPTDEKTISAIETHGCFIISVGRECRNNLLWTYSIGVYDTSGKPDFITVGLPPKTAHHCLNEAARRERSGVDLSVGRHSEMIGNVECEFRPVDPKWVGRLMNWANWYYGGTNYPVLQIIYPDLENRFPEEPGFNSRFAQPFLQPGAPFGELEREFWISIDDAERFPNWRFEDKPHMKVFISETVSRGEEFVTYVSHDAEDGAWQFLGDSMMDGGGPVLECLHAMVEKDPTLVELADLPKGWYAERESPAHAWERAEAPDDEDES